MPFGSRPSLQGRGLLLEATFESSLICFRFSGESKQGQRKVNLHRVPEPPNLEKDTTHPSGALCTVVSQAHVVDAHLEGRMLKSKATFESHLSCYNFKS